MTRKLTRLDEDLYETLREQAHRANTDITAIVNGLLRYALPLAEAGVFNVDQATILEALAQHGVVLADPARANRAAFTAALKPQVRPR